MATGNAVRPTRKAPTGIAGFDGMTGGGLPRGRTTLLAGGPGSGKTIFALGFLVHGARRCGENGIFVAFEETSKRIVINTDGFGWNLQALQPRRIHFMDAQVTPDLIQTGAFDLSGMLASLGASARQVDAQRIVFDGLDVLLALLPDAAACRREVNRIHQWLLARELTGLITANAGAGRAGSIGIKPLGFMQFMVDCTVVLNHSVVSGVSQRNLRVQKYRGSAIDENESPFVIGRYGIDVASARMQRRMPAKSVAERVTSGMGGLDAMLGGGYQRGACVLVTGLPGTAKTTLGGVFAEAACRRGERTLFVSLEPDAADVTRNLMSVGIRLQKFVTTGRLRIIPAHTIAGSAEIALVRIKAEAREHHARCLVIDPVSMFSRPGNEATAQGVAERLVDWIKSDGITLVCTNMLDELSREAGNGAPLQMSTLADTWIHLNYLVQAGERNRGLSIIKSRGSAHSNQVRELILADNGVTLADICTGGGELRSLQTEPVANQAGARMPPRIAASRAAKAARARKPVPAMRGAGVTAPGRR